jgi:mRNA-degrading endonuclease RelE of RelBE toxin-antitoxin system
MGFEVKIVPSALEELRDIPVFHRRRIALAIDERLVHEPTVVTRHRKPIEGADPSFEYERPLWELRVGEFRVFYDVDEANAVVLVRAIREKPPHATSEQIL